MAGFEIPDWATPETPAAPPPDPIVTREEKVANDTRVEQSLNRFIAGKQAALFEAPDAFYRAQGEDAIHAAPGTTQKLDELRRDLLDRLGNDTQRQRLGEALDAQMHLAREGMARHVAEQSLEWQRGVAQDRIALLAKEASLHHNDGELVDSLGHAAATAARAHSRVGDGPPGGDAEDAAAANARSGVLGAAIQARLDRGNTEGANALFTQVQDQLDPEHAAPLQGQLDAGLMMVLPYRPSPDNSTIETVPLPYRPPMDGKLDEASILENLANVPEGESAPDQNSGEIVPVNVTPNDAIDAAKADPHRGDTPGANSLFTQVQDQLDPEHAGSLQGQLAESPRRGVAPVVEPLPGSPEHEAANAQVKDARLAADDISPGEIVVLPNGVQVTDGELLDDRNKRNKSPTGYMMSPVADVAPVAEAGRKAGDMYRSLQQSDDPLAASSYLATALFRAVGTGGDYDYQRRGSQLGGLIKHVLGVKETFAQRPQYRNVSNFNVGLFAQQAGMNLEDTLTTAGEWAKRFGTSDPSAPYGLYRQTAKFIDEGHKAGEGGAFSSSGLPENNPR